MLLNDNLYQSILKELSHIPYEHLPQVETMLKDIKKEIDTKKSNREEIMAFAGAWEEMTKSDFQSYLGATKEMFIDINKDDLW